MDLAALFDMWRQNSTSGCYLTIFNVDVALACHFVTPHPLPTLSPYRSANGIGYTSKKLSKMVGKSAGYPFNSWCIDKL